MTEKPTRGRKVDIRDGVYVSLFQYGDGFLLRFMNMTVRTELTISADAAGALFSLLEERVKKEPAWPAPSDATHFGLDPTKLEWHLVEQVDQK